jgi:NADH:ubiquinone oxidoreductase subunit 2 (subunit N)
MQEASIKNFWLNILCTMANIIGISLLYYVTGETNVNKVLILMNILAVTNYTWSGIFFIFVILAIIGKFGLFPGNLGVFGILDGISLFSSLVLLGLNKYVYLLILG